MTIVNGSFVDGAQEKMPNRSTLASWGYLSARCLVCGDSSSMPPVGKPVLAADRYRSKYGRAEAEVAAVLHLCTNQNCIGATVGYYSVGRDDRRLELHAPKFRRFGVSDEVPKRSRAILQIVNDSRSSPVACATTAVRAVEAMLAEESYRDRKHSLKRRIDNAVADGNLPKAMGDWAHEIREIGNETHTDDDPTPLPGKEDAEQVLLFASTLAQYLFVMPARIKKARGAEDEDED